ncbi:MAG: hypothetical protein LBB45_05945 [Methanobrevibacter sp.]|jgi:hypothetical protein|nr:hypothetical protein [Candidatus Methanovirga basalitermitum]
MTTKRDFLRHTEEYYCNYRVMEKYNNPCRIGYTYSQDKTLQVTVKYTGKPEDITDWIDKVKLYGISDGKYHDVIYNVGNDPIGLFTYTSNNFNYEAFVLSLIDRVDDSPFIVDENIYYIAPTSIGGGRQPTNITSPNGTITVGGSGYNRTVDVAFSLGVFLGSVQTKASLPATLAAVQAFMAR